MAKALETDAPPPPPSSSTLPSEQLHSGTTGHPTSGSREITSASNVEQAAHKSFFGSLTRRPQPQRDPIPAVVRSTPTPLPLSQQNPSQDTETEESEAEEDDDEEGTLSEDTQSMNSTTDVHPGQPSHPITPSPPSVFYPSAQAKLDSHSQRRHLNLLHPHAHQQPHQHQPVRSHTNLLQLTTASLQAASSPHPLITPRSGSSGASSPGALLFPHSCNLPQSYPRSRTILTTLHKTRIVRRLESPGSLTASEELSILPFVTRTPGLRASADPRSSIYPSASSSYRHRTSLMRNLGVEDGELMREVDINAHVQGQGFPTFSKGLKRWVSRPSFQQRTVVYVPVAKNGDVGVVRSAVHRTALNRPAPLVFSEGLEALAGVVKPKRNVVSWRTKASQAITQGRCLSVLNSLMKVIADRKCLLVVAPLHHPKPRPGLVSGLHSMRPLEGLLIPSPPQLSSSPSSSASGDTAPNTPASNNSSGQNLASFVPPVFIQKLRQNNNYNVPDIEDEDDLPLGVVVISKRSIPEEDITEKVRRVREKAAAKAKRKSEKDAAAKQSFKQQVMASRMRSESYRTTGRAASLSDEWIEVEEPRKPPRRDERSPARSIQSRRSSGLGPAVHSSAQSIRSQSSVRSRATAVRPPSVAASDRSRSSSNPHHYHGRQHAAAPFVNPATAFQVPPHNVGGGSGAGFVPGFPGVPYPPTFFVPQPPSKVTSTQSRRTSINSVSSLGEFGAVSRSQAYKTLPNRTSATPSLRTPLDSQFMSLSRSSGKVSSSYLAPPERRVSDGSSNSGGSAKRASVAMSIPRMPREIS